jgi:hypothetical protein
MLQKGNEHLTVVFLSKIIRAIKNLLKSKWLRHLLVTLKKNRLQKSNPKTLVIKYGDGKLHAVTLNKRRS